MYIYGAGAHSKVVFHILKKNYKYKNITFVDDKKKGLFYEHKIISFNNYNKIKSKKNIHIAIGDCNKRKNIFNKLNIRTNKLITIIEKNSFIYETAKISHGCFIAPKSIIGPNALIGISAIINHGAIIDHDVKIGDFAHIAPGSVIGGEVTIGKSTLVGSNSVILPGLTIGNNVVIGSGSVVTKNLNDNIKVFGNPAKKK